MNQDETRAGMAGIKRRLPAEWEGRRATWLAWPRDQGDFRPKLRAVTWAHAEIVRLLAAGQGEEVRLLVADAAQERAARGDLKRAGADLGKVRFVTAPTDRGWTRDYLPFFVHEQGPGHGSDEKARLLAVRFGFTGWARYADHLRDQEAAKRVMAWVAEEDGVTGQEARHGGRLVVLEGGAIDSNGQGTLLTTEECLLDPKVQVRNPGFARKDYEALLAEHLGARNVIWLGRGIAGDDTHGHVDDFCRFVNPSTVLLCHEADGADPNHRVLEENRERLEQAALQDGSRPEVIRLPLPAPLFFDTMRLPASYANFLVGKARVLVPTFNDPKDRLALGILAECFPDREVVGVHAVDLLLGQGGVHCLTHEQPEAF